jgi:hypothetical protein
MDIAIGYAGLLIVLIAVGTGTAAVLPSWGFSD